MIGFSTKAITWGRHPASQQEANELLLTAMAAGSRFISAAEYYGGAGINLRYLSHFLNIYPKLRKEVIVSVKGAFEVDKTTMTTTNIYKSVNDDDSKNEPKKESNNDSDDTISPTTTRGNKKEEKHEDASGDQNTNYRGHRKSVNYLTVDEANTAIIGTGGRRGSTVTTTATGFTSTGTPHGSREDIHKSIDHILELVNPAHKHTDESNRRRNSHIDINGNSDVTENINNEDNNNNNDNGNDDDDNDSRMNIVFSCARVDPNVPIEETVSAIQEYVDQGKIKGVALCEASVETIRKAAKVAPISFVEVEFFLFTRDILYSKEKGGQSVAEVCKELGITIVASSPLGGGLLTGEIRDVEEDIPEDDYRRNLDRFDNGNKEGSQEPDREEQSKDTESVDSNDSNNFEHNLQLVEKLEAIADETGLTLAQLSLAWINFFNSPDHPDREKYPTFVSVPVATKPVNILANARVKEIDLKTFEEIQKVLEENRVAGERYNEEARRLLNI